MSAASEERCGFLDLPPELRNRIYELVTIQDEQIWIWDFLKRDADGEHFIQLKEPAIAATCWQIREESLAVYYGYNVFIMEIGKHASTVGGFDVLASFFDSIGVEGCKNLWDLQLTLTADYEPKAREFLPLIRIFCRGEEAVPGVSSMFVYYTHEKRECWRRGRERDAWERGKLLWRKHHHWTVEFARDLCEVGNKLRAKGIIEPSDDEIKIAIGRYLPIGKQVEYQEKSSEVWEFMQVNSHFLAHLGVPKYPSLS